MKLNKQLGKAIDDSLRQTYPSIEKSIDLTIENSIDLFFKRQDEHSIEKAFSDHADASSGKAIVKSQGVRAALGELGIKVSEPEAEELVSRLDADRNGGLDWEEFRGAVQKPPSELDQWINTIPVAGLLASALQAVVPDGDQLRQMSMLSEESRDAAVEAVGKGLKRLMSEAHAKLKQAIDNVDAKARAQKDGAANKFQTINMSGGTVQQYFEGLFGRVGKFFD